MENDGYSVRFWEVMKAIEKLAIDYPEKYQLGVKHGLLPMAWLRQK